MPELDDIEPLLPRTRTYSRTTTAPSQPRLVAQLPQHGVRLRLWQPFSLQQLKWRYLQPFGNTLQRLECQITLPPFQSTHVRAVDTQYVGKGLLAQTTGNPVGPQVAAHRPLQIALH